MSEGSRQDFLTGVETERRPGQLPATPKQISFLKALYRQKQMLLQPHELIEFENDRRLTNRRIEELKRSKRKRWI